MKTIHPTFKNHVVLNKTLIQHALMTAGLVVGLGFGTAMAAPADAPAAQPQSASVGAAIDDTAITAKVKTRLMGKDSLKKSDISVTTVNGVVTLDGSASSAKARTLAGTSAKSVAGVKSVDNKLIAPVNSSSVSTKTHEVVAKTERVASDSWITTKVKSELLADSISKSFEVSVKTMHGVVALKGVLANQGAIDHVKGIAAKVKGVKSVDTSALTVAG